MFRCVQWYTNYSMAHHLRKYIIPKGNRLDPELDVEAQFSNRTVREAQSRIAKGMRKQCITGWLWCECNPSPQALSFRLLCSPFTASQNSTTLIAPGGRSCFAPQTEPGGLHPRQSALVQLSQS